MATKQKSKSGWTPLYNYIWGSPALRANEKLFYLGIKSYCWKAKDGFRNEEVFPSQRVLAKKLGIGRSTIVRLQKEWTDLGILTILSPGKPSKEGTHYLFSEKRLLDVVIEREKQVVSPRTTLNDVVGPKSSPMVVSTGTKVVSTVHQGGITGVSYTYQYQTDQINKPIGKDLGSTSSSQAEPVGSGGDEAAPAVKRAEYQPPKVDLVEFDQFLKTATKDQLRYRQIHDPVFSKWLVDRIQTRTKELQNEIPHAERAEMQEFHQKKDQHEL